MAPIVPEGADRGIVTEPEVVEGCARGIALAVEQIIPIRTGEYPTPAKRPRNSRLDLTRLHQVFGLTPPTGQSALAPELDELAREMNFAG
jgi:dTDP-4-dehydrorhamnose reductase